MIKEAIVKIVNKGDLTYDEAYTVMNEIMSGETTATQNAAFLAALSTKSARAETTKDDFLPVCRKFGVDLISMIAPTSENRIAMIAREAEGFLYIVSSLGVTGVRSEIKTDIAAIVDVVRKNTEIPCAVGFGISTPEQARKMADLSDGAIVGSAVIRLIAEYGKESPEKVGAYIRSMKDAIM